MSALIKIKSSTVADKVPASLQPAELAVNLTDQKLYSADANGVVFELGATGGAIPSPTPPAGPSEGELWFDSDNDTLNFWDGSQWVELGEASQSGVISVNTQVGVVVLDADDVGAVATTGKTAQGIEGAIDIEGNLTINTDKITLDAGDGSITAAGDIKANTVTTGDADVSSTTAEGAVMRVNGIVDAQRKAGSSSAAVRVWQGDQTTIEMFANGSITAAGDIELNRLRASGYIRSTRTSPTHTVLEGLLDEGSPVQTSLITADGSVKLGGTLPIAPNIELKNDGTITAAGGHTINSWGIAGPTNLDLYGSSSSSYGWRVTNDTKLISGTDFSDPKIEIDGTTGSITAAGSVGIGTDSPATTLHLSSSDPRLTITDSDQSTKSTQLRNTNGNTYLSQLTSGSIIFGAPDEKMRIQDDGHVGIGTSSAGHKLTVLSEEATGIMSKCSNTQATNTNKALLVANNSLTASFSVSYTGEVTAASYNLEALSPLPA